MSKTVGRVFFFLVALILLVWGGYHLARYSTDIIESETVFRETVPQSLVGRGIAIREEQQLTPLHTGASHFLYPDATRIGIGQPIVEYYTGENKTESMKELRELEQELQLLEEAQNNNLNNFASAPIISRDIREQLSTLTQITSTGNCHGLSAVRYDLSLLVNRRQIATGKISNFNPRIEELEGKIELLRTESDYENIQEGYTPVSGYFVKNTDGFEAKLTPDMLEQWNIDDYLDLVEKVPNEEVIGHNGKIVTNSKWYFAVCVPSYQIEWVRTGQATDIIFDQFSEPIPAKIENLLIENNQDTAVILLSSDQITEDILNVRVADVTLSFSQFTGLKINTSNIRFRENVNGETERGVYILENYVVKFRLIDPIYEEQSFVLSRLNTTDEKDKKYVRLYDQVIIPGSDIYEGKIIQ